MLARYLSCLALFLWRATAALDPDCLVISTLQGPVSGNLVTPKFRPPKPAPLRFDILNATSYGDACPQERVALLSSLSGPAGNLSEDCLSVNIWAPAITRPQKTAVLIWVYGGGDNIGSSTSRLYSGVNFVENFNDITIVSFNYRVSIFGFPNAPQLAGKASNFGLLDFEAAVIWVHENIAAFGGDPQRISVFGESAGAFAVDAYAYSHVNDTSEGHYRGIGIVVDSLAPEATNSTPVAVWNYVADVVGCGIANDTAQFNCMQNLTWPALLAGVGKVGLNFFPSPDGHTIFASTAARAASGDFLKVPLLMGNNANEGDLFIVGLQQTANVTLNASAFEEFSLAVTDVFFACPAANSTASRVTNGVPSYRYVYAGVYPDITGRDPELRSFHGSEIPLVFGTYNLSSLANATSAEIELSNYMQSAWVAFARDPEHGLASAGWPLYSPGTDTTALLGNNSTNPGGATFVSGSVFDTACAMPVSAYPPHVQVVLAQVAEAQ